MIRIILLLVTLMSSSVMAQEEPDGKAKVINLVCMTSTVTLRLEEGGTKTYGLEEIIEMEVNAPLNRNVSVSETQGYDETYYAMDTGSGFGFQKAQMANNKVSIFADGGDPIYKDTEYEGTFMWNTLNLLTSEYTRNIYDEKGDGLLLSQSYECKEAKSLFD